MRWATLRARARQARTRATVSQVSAPRRAAWRGAQAGGRRRRAARAGSPGSGRRGARPGARSRRRACASIGAHAPSEAVGEVVVDVGDHRVEQRDDHPRAIAPRARGRRATVQQWRVGGPAGGGASTRQPVALGEVEHHPLHPRGVAEGAAPGGLGHGRRHDGVGRREHAPQVLVPTPPRVDRPQPGEGGVEARPAVGDEGLELTRVTARHGDPTLQARHPRARVQPRARPPPRTPSRRN
jgi:hypothetical protein